MPRPLLQSHPDPVINTPCWLPASLLEEAEQQWRWAAAEGTQTSEFQQQITWARFKELLKSPKAP